MRRGTALAIALTALAMTAAPSLGVRTRAFLVEGARTFADATMRGVAVHEDGTIAPGPAVEALAPEAGAQVWSLLRARDGSIYAGTGSEGAVYRLHGGEVDRVAGTFEYEVFALAEGSQGRIYASGAPNGTIQEIAPGQTPRTFFDTPEKIVWAVVTDREGNVYAATGERGYLYRVKPSGEAEVLYRAEDSHIVTLVWSKEGKLLAGTDGRGLLLEIDPERGSARVLYDTPYREVPRIVTAPDGTVYFAAVGSQGDSQPGGGNGEDPPEGGEQPVITVQAQRPASRLYVREPDGAVRGIWQSLERTVHSLALDGEGNLLVGTGSEAALYRVTPDGRTTLLWKPEEGQVLSLAVDGGVIFASTGNPGRVYRLGPDRGSEAWLRSEPLDAVTSSGWGRAVWEVLPGEGRWELRTRSGHTERPDSSWSDWSLPLKDPDGSAVESPRARFLQVEARYVGEGSGGPARLRRIWIPYSEPNLPPRVEEIRFTSELPATQSKEGGGEESFTQELGGGVRVQIQRSGSPASQGAEPPPWVREVRTISWSAGDPNGDDLRYEVGLRQVGENGFRTLARELSAPAYSLDARTLPEGAYEVRVRADDASSNPPGQGLSAERVGGPFRVDHGPPEIIDLRASHPEPKKLVVEGTARDDASPIRRVEISWDGEAWRPLISTDGFLDSREEHFRVEVSLEDPEAGSWIAVRATDAAGNESVARSWLPR